MVNALESIGTIEPAGAAEGLCVVGASAGSGKTHHLTAIVLGALAGGESAIDVQNLVAVTYTTRAATELRSRIRTELMRRGEAEKALRLPLARLGTVHAVCLAWAQEFAIDAGLPPGIQVLPDDGGMQFRSLLEAAIPTELSERLSTLARRLQVQWNAQNDRSMWLWEVFELTELARANRIAPAALPAMAQRSVAWLDGLLPVPSRRDLDAALREALDGADAALRTSADGTQKTADVRKKIRQVGHALRRGRASWADWATLATLEPGAKSRDIVAPLREVAAEYAAHPAFQSDLRELIMGVFECARLGLENYQSWKARLRLVDYVDMLESTLRLLGDTEISRELARGLELVVVDEFQDTSPIQLELFLRLHHMGARSTWVGDRKQCIFEFAGADPALMDSVAEWVKQNGGEHPQLASNYRSRAELVTFCSELFGAALLRDGFSREEVVVAPARERVPALDALPPLGLFCLTSKSMEGDAAAIAHGVLRLLSDPAATPVLDRETRQVRPLRAGDIAVLVRTNGEAEAIAAALGKLRVPVALARPGLLRTPEGTLVDAALSYIIDITDGVASAVIDALHGFGEHGPDQWLEQRIREHHARRDAVAAAETRAPDEPAAGSSEQTGWRSALSSLRGSTVRLSPRETLDAVIDALDLDRMALGWPDPEQRRGNLDALRALATRYEDMCRVTGAAATIGGLLHYFDQAREQRWDGTEMRARDEQHFSEGHDAVVLCTYHRSKGLEWPVVILGSLDAKPRGDAFGVHIESSTSTLDPEHPLDGRWIRYSPRPFPSRSKFALSDAEAASPEGNTARQNERRERARLLYVGFTRARDHLILAARSRRGSLDTTWLDELSGPDGDPLLALSVPSDTTEPTSLHIRGTQTHTPVRSWVIAPEQTASTPTNDTTPLLALRRPPSGPVRAPFRITPSAVDNGWPELPALEVAELIRLGDPHTVRRSGDVEWATFGDMIHRFLASDRVGDLDEHRSAKAERLIAACASGATLESAALIDMSDRLHSFVAKRWPEAQRHAEVPVRLRLGESSTLRELNGTIDLLLETPGGYIVIDHKTYGNPSEAALRSEAVLYTPQLAAYGEALRALGGKPVLEYLLHFAIAGACVRCRRVE